MFPMMMGMAFGLFVLGALTYCYGYTGSEPERTESHTEEIYHGNWWGTWHTPDKIRLIHAGQVLTILGIALFIVIAVMKGV